MKSNIWNDTLRPNGRYEVKRVLAVNGFNAFLIYIFLPYFKPTFQPDYTIAIALLTFTCGCLGIALTEKIKLQNNNITTENNGS